MGARPIGSFGDYEHITFAIPAAAARAAKDGLSLRAMYGRGGTDVGIDRAKQLSTAKAVTLRDIVYIRSYFARHIVDNLDQKSPPSNGWIAWQLWGGWPMQRAAIEAYQWEIDNGYLKPSRGASRQPRSPRARRSSSGVSDDDVPPPGMSLEDARKWIAKRHWQIGRGCYRDAYVIDADKVIKVVRIRENTRQNAVEWNALHAFGTDYAVEPIAHDGQNNHWIVTERVEPVSDEVFLDKLEQLGLPRYKTHGDLSTMLVSLVTGMNHDMTEQMYRDAPRVIANPWFVGLANRVLAAGISPHDFYPQNWGLREDGTMVLLDMTDTIESIFGQRSE
jgi:hypothetical protein